MPTYDYECKRCGHRIEIFHAVNATVKKKCPKCKGALHRLIGGGCGLIFKGSGFYITDYKRKENKQPKKKKTGCANDTAPDTKKNSPKKDKET